jgi:hypothetical protein
MLERSFYLMESPRADHIRTRGATVLARVCEAIAFDAGAYQRSRPLLGVALLYHDCTHDAA